MALIGFAILPALCFIGFPPVFATLAVGLVGHAFTRDWNWLGAFTMIGQKVMETGANYGLSVIPPFILTGVFIHRSNISEEVFRAAHALVGHRKGGLGQASVLACAGASGR